MSQQYTLAIAGNFRVRPHPDRPGVRQPLPTEVSVTVLAEDCWPIWHAAIGHKDLTGLWWYAPAEQARPTLTAAAAYLDAHAAELAALPGSGPALVATQRAVLARLLEDLGKHADNVIALGREQVHEPVWEPVDPEADE